MTDPHDRLQIARARAGFANATDAARAFGFNENTFRSHENGERGISRAAARYARALRVSEGWLLTGEGDMERKNIIAVTGFMGLDEEIKKIEGAPGMPLEEIELPYGFLVENCFALISRGNSQYPRVKDGEVVVYHRNGATPDDRIGVESVVKIVEGPMLLKTIRRGSIPGMFNLESHNGPTRENEQIEWIGDVLSIIPAGKWHMVR